MFKCLISLILFFFLFSFFLFFFFRILPLDFSVIDGFDSSSPPVLPPSLPTTYQDTVSRQCFRFFFSLSFPFFFLFLFFSLFFSFFLFLPLYFFFNLFFFYFLRFFDGELYYSDENINTLLRALQGSPCLRRQVNRFLSVL